MPGLRERKRQQTLAAIHDAAMDLFAQRGYADVTVTDIAEAAQVSRATVFAYYPAKEDIVLGAAPAALDALAAALDGLGDRRAIVAALRAWLRSLVGWLEPELVLQVRLSEEVPAVAAARSRMLGEVAVMIAAALTRAMGEERRYAARLAAASLTAALASTELEAARQMERGRALAAAEVDALFDEAIAFVEGGLSRVGVPASRKRARRTAGQTQ